jgi:hypothetical protein
VTCRVLTGAKIALGDEVEVFAGLAKARPRLPG